MGELLTQAAEVEGVLREAAVHQLRVAYQWAITHPVLDASETPSGPTLPAVLDVPETLGGAGTPSVAAFTPEPFAVATGCSPASVSSLLADALDLHHRLPLLWDQTQAGLVATWKARRIALRTRDLSAEAAGWVDRQLAGMASSLGASALDRLVAEAAARHDGEELKDHETRARKSWDVTLQRRDPDQGAGTSELHAVGDTLDLTRFHDVVCAEAEAMGVLGDTDTLGVWKAKALGLIADTQARLDLTSLLNAGHPRERDQAERDEARRTAIARRDAKVRLYLHVSLTDVLTRGATSTSTGTVEGLGPATLDVIREWVGKARASIQPVIHVAAEDRWSMDRHDPHPAMAEQVRLRDERCVFPWCNRGARQCDLDHLIPYVPPEEGGPPGQTSPDGLAPLCRRHHRAKTSGRWRYLTNCPGSYIWTGPAGLTALVTPTGTITIPTS